MPLKTWVWKTGPAVTVIPGVHLPSLFLSAGMANIIVKLEAKHLHSPLARQGFLTHVRKAIRWRLRTKGRVLLVLLGLEYTIISYSPWNKIHACYKRPRKLLFTTDEIIMLIIHQQIMECTWQKGKLTSSRKPGSFFIQSKRKTNTLYLDIIIFLVRSIFAEGRSTYQSLPGLNKDPYSLLLYSDTQHFWFPTHPTKPVEWNISCLLVIRHGDWKVHS